jgi:hypothetical protein
MLFDRDRERAFKIVIIINIHPRYKLIRFFQLTSVSGFMPNNMNGRPWPKSYITTFVILENIMLIKCSLIIKLQLFEETVVEWNSSDLVGKFIENLGLTHVDKTRHTDTKKLFPAQILKTMFDYFEMCLINLFLKVNNINYRALHRYEWHYSLLKFPGKDINLIHVSHISHPDAGYSDLFIYLKIVVCQRQKQGDIVPQ